jgi:hypothetical protein
VAVGDEFGGLFSDVCDDVAEDAVEVWAEVGEEVLDTHETPVQFGAGWIQCGEVEVDGVGVAVVLAFRVIVPETRRAPAQLRGCWDCLAALRAVVGGRCGLLDVGEFVVEAADGGRLFSDSTQGWVESDFLSLVRGALECRGPPFLYHWLQAVTRRANQGRRPRHGRGRQLRRRWRRSRRCGWVGGGAAADVVLHDLDSRLRNKKFEL